MLQKKISVIFKNISVHVLNKNFGSYFKKVFRVMLFKISVHVTKKNISGQISKKISDQMSKKNFGLNFR